MIYLQRECEEFARTKDEFTAAYADALKAMHSIFREKARARDVGSPFHHRQAPNVQLSIAQVKCLRVESLMSEPGWEADTRKLAQIIEEAGDAANFLVFISALCSMLAKELE